MITGVSMFSHTFVYMSHHITNVYGAIKTISLRSLCQSHGFIDAIIRISHTLLYNSHGVVGVLMISHRLLCQSHGFIGAITRISHTLLYKSQDIIWCQNNRIICMVIGAISIPQSLMYNPHHINLVHNFSWITVPVTWLYWCQDFPQTSICIRHMLSGALTISHGLLCQSHGFIHITLFGAIKTIFAHGFI